MRIRPTLATAALFGFAIFLLFWGLGASSFHSGDESLYSVCAREMIERGDYLTPHYMGEPFLEKPPAKFWLIAAGLRLLGVNEWGARLSSAVFALGTVGVTVLLGRALLGTWPALLAGAILTSSVQFVHEHCGRTAEMEPESAFFFTVSMLLLHRMTREPRWAPVLGAAIGCLILVKGPIALPLLLIAALYLAWSRPLPAGTSRQLFLGAIVMLALVVPWHARMLSTHGDLFRDIYLESHVLARLTGHAPDGVETVVPGLRARPRLFYYVPVLFSAMFPWSLLVLPAVPVALVAALRRPPSSVRLPVLWFLVYGATITVTNAKHPWYTVPLLPAVALLVAWFVNRLRTVDSRAVVVGGGAIVLALSLFFAPNPSYHPYTSVSTLWPDPDHSLAAVTALSRADLVSWVPLGANAVVFALVLAAAMLMRVGGGSGVRVTFRRCVVGSLLLTGVCHAALPLRGVDNRDHFAHDFAVSSRVLRERGLTPNRLLALDEETLDVATKWVTAFYVHDLSGGSGSVVGLEGGPRSWGPNLLRSGTVLIGQPRWAADALATGRVEELWTGRTMFAAYVP